MTDPITAHFDEGMIERLLNWADHPELERLYARLLSHSDDKAFLDTLAEAVMARHLLDEGCTLKLEVPTPSGRACDFEVTYYGARFFLHIKRLNTKRSVRKKLNVSSRLRTLERIERPYVVQVRWLDDLDDDQMQHYVTSAAHFIPHARVGDEMVVRYDDGQEIGGVRIVAPWEGDHVTLVIGLPTGFIDEVVRVRKLLRKAYRQFMPRETNVILVCTSNPTDVTDMETALMGSHIERWDAFPPRGHRVAHGRDADGFWYDNRNAESMAAGWFCLYPRLDLPKQRLWLRQSPALDADMRGVLKKLFSPRD